MIIAVEIWHGFRDAIKNASQLLRGAPTLSACLCYCYPFFSIHISSNHSEPIIQDFEPYLFKWQITRIDIAHSGRYRLMSHNLLDLLNSMPLLSQQG